MSSLRKLSVRSALLSLPVILAGCSGGDLAHCVFPVSLGDDETHTQLVTAEEGGLVCTDEVAVIFPEGALAEDTEITVRKTTLEDGDADGEVVGPVVELGPAGLTFDEPVLVTLRPGNVDVDQLTMYSLSNGVTEELTDVYPESTLGTITGSTRHFSIFYSAFAGPTFGGEAVQVGGANLNPMFGGSDSSEPPYVDVYVSPGGAVTSEPYSGNDSDVLVIQIDTGLDEGQQVYVQHWTVDPVDVGAQVVDPPGERVSTNGFWHLLFSEIANGIRDLRTNEAGVITYVMRGDYLYGRLAQAPVGYPSGRMRLRVFDEDPASSVDIYVSLARLD